MYCQGPQEATAACHLLDAGAMLCRCSIRNCEEDGIVAQDRSQLEAEACTVSACKGPALDLTLHARATVTDCSLTNSSGASLPCLPRVGRRHPSCAARTKPSHTPLPNDPR